MKRQHFAYILLRQLLSFVRMLILFYLPFPPRHIFKPIPKCGSSNGLDGMERVTLTTQYTFSSEALFARHHHTGMVQISKPATPCCLIINFKTIYVISLQTNLLLTICVTEHLLCALINNILEKQFQQNEEKMLHKYYQMKANLFNNELN